MSRNVETLPTLIAAPVSYTHLIIPREEGAIGIREGTVRDIAVISRVNRPVCFIITDFAVDENGERFAAVSYPHLDVYKRQSVCFSLSDKTRKCL